MTNLAKDSLGAGVVDATHATATSLPLSRRSSKRPRSQGLRAQNVIWLLDTSS
jgi:hypothetical protein